MTEIVSEPKNQHRPWKKIIFNLETVKQNERIAVEKHTWNERSSCYDLDIRSTFNIQNKNWEDALAKAKQAAHELVDQL